MTQQITLSDNFAKKLMDFTFGKEYETNMVKSFIQWLIDSKHRKYKRLDLFIRHQIEEPSDDVLALAKNFSKIRDYDKRIVEILRYVRDYTDYVSDIEQYNRKEHWATAEEVIESRKDDCDGINATIHVLARLSGIPSYLLYSCIGKVSAGGHYWLVYLSPKTGQMYPIDGTYYYDRRAIPHRRTLNSLYTKIWYVFNDRHIWKPKN